MILTGEAIDAHKAERDGESPDLIFACPRQHDYILDQASIVETVMDSFSKSIPCICYWIYGLLVQRI